MCNQVNFIEATIRGWFKNANISLSDVLHGIHNVSCHGEHLPCHVTDEELGKLFDAYDVVLKVAAEIEGE